MKARAEAAAAAAGVTFNRWLEELVLREAPPLLDLDTTSVSDQEDVQMAS